MLKIKYENFLILVSFNLYKDEKLIAKYYNLNIYTEKQILDKFNTTKLKGSVGKFSVELAKKVSQQVINYINQKELKLNLISPL